MYERTPGAKSNGGVGIGKNLSLASAIRLPGVPLSAMTVALALRPRYIASSVRLTCPDTEMPMTRFVPGPVFGTKSAA